MNPSHTNKPSIRLGISFKKHYPRWIAYVLLVVFSVVYLIPFVWLLSSSLKTDAAIFRIPSEWIPRPAQWRNYAEVFTQVPFLRFLGNTVVITALVIFSNVFVSAMVAYAFARLRAPGKNALFLLLLSTMMLPGQVTMIPKFIMFSKVNWINTLLPMIIPSFLGGSALYVFLIRQFFSGISNSIDEAAKIDGAGYFSIFFRILLPMSKPVLITVGVFSFVGSWNDFMDPLIYLHDVEKFTLAIGLNLFKTQYVQNWNYTMAYNVMMILPVVVLFFIAQKSFIQGVVITGNK